MVNELRELMRDATDRPPHDPGDLRALLGAGRRRVRVRRAVRAGGTALAVGALALGANTFVNPLPADLAAAGVPRPDAPTARLADARPAVAGQDYRELASWTNEDLESDNGEYFDGVTDDGLVLFREGQTMTRPDVRYALMDPATGEKQWLPAWPGGGEQAFALRLSEEELVLGRFESVGDGMRTRPVVDVYDRGSETWQTVTWPALPGDENPSLVTIGPDGRAYVAVVTDASEVPPGGWPIGPDGEADDADAPGEVRALWSMSLSDPADVRLEQRGVGDFAFDGDTLVWTDSTNGDSGRIHVRDLATGKVTSFDPRSGERCNLLGFDVAGGRIAMSQYCGTYAGGVRDDRVQVVTTGGEQVVTFQENGVESGGLVGGGDYLTLTGWDRATGGTYLYDFARGELVRLSDAPSSWAVAQGPVPGDELLWSEPVGRAVDVLGATGATAHLSEVVR